MTVRELSVFLGVMPDRSREIGSLIPDLKFPATERVNRWELCTESDTSGDVTSLVEDVARRMLPLLAPLRDLRNLGCVVNFEIVQYLSPHDSVGPGFVLSPDTSKMFADVGCDVDIDLYVADDWDSE
jgi:hypothetical protein